MGNIMDIAGMRFGRLVAIERAESFVQPSGQIKTAWKCKCDCGTEVVVRTTDLKTGKKKSCGCYRKEFRVHDLTGQRFGRLVAIRPESNNGHGIEWLCKCDCGNETVVRCDGLITGHCTSCGCYNKELKRNYLHGMYKTRLYRVWCGMKQRCNNPNCDHYYRYGGRGIKICPEWNDKHGFDKFAKWAIACSFIRRSERRLKLRSASVPTQSVRSNRKQISCIFCCQENLIRMIARSSRRCFRCLLQAAQSSSGVQR